MSSVEDLFAGSNGQYYTDWELRRKRRCGDWRLCLRQTDPDRLVVETREQSLLALRRVDPAAAPHWLEIRIDGETVRAVDTRHVSAPTGDVECRGVDRPIVSRQSR